LIFLKEGNLIYQGQAQMAKKYFKEIGFKMPQYINPFDFFLGVLSDPVNSPKVLSDNYNKLCEEEVRDERIKLHEEYKTLEIATLKYNLREINWCAEYLLLLKRSIINYVRNTPLFVARVIGFLVNTLVIMGFYWQMGDPSKEANLYSNFTGYFFNNVNTFFVNGIYTAIFMIPTVKKVLKREYSAKLYRISTFYLAFATTMLINSMIFAFLFTPVTHFTIHLKPDLKTFLYNLLLNLFNFTLGQILGLFFGGTLPQNISFVVTPFAFIIFYLGAGFLRGASSLPSYISWLPYISPYKYLLELYVGNESSYRPGITDHIPNDLKLNLGLEICIPVLMGMMLFILLLGYIGIRLFAAKY
jgi:hypothetical protein